MKDSFLSVWIDERSGFGTFPLESMKMNIPVIGLVPNLVPEWMTEDNGIWINNLNGIVEVIADYVQNWLEDNINPELYEGIQKTAEKYSDYEKFESDVQNLFDKFINTRLESFEEQLNKFQTIE